MSKYIRQSWPPTCIWVESHSFSAQTARLLFLWPITAWRSTNRPINLMETFTLALLASPLSIRAVVSQFALEIGTDDRVSRLYYVDFIKTQLQPVALLNASSPPRRKRGCPRITKLPTFCFFPQTALQSEQLTANKKHPVFYLVSFPQKNINYKNLLFVLSIWHNFWGRILEIYFHLWYVSTD